jgi:hypothetical protein
MCQKGGLPVSLFIIPDSIPTITKDIEQLTSIM